MVRKIKAKVPIAQVIFDEKYYPRNDYFWQVGYDYSESMKTGAKFPRIVLAKLNNNLILVDGRHRLEAHKLLKKKSIDAEVLIGLPEDRIYLEAVKRNIAHGRPLSVQEKLNVAVKLRDLKYPNEEICKIVQIPAGKLKNLLGRRLFNSITGEEIILKNEFEAVSKSPYADIAKVDVDTIQHSFIGTSQENLIDELIVLLTTKALDIRDDKIKNKLKNLKILLGKLKLK